MRTAWAVAVLLTAACGEGPSGPRDTPEVFGQLEPTAVPAGYEGPADFVGYRYAFKGQLNLAGQSMITTTSASQSGVRGDSTTPSRWSRCHLKPHGEDDPSTGSMLT